METPNAISEFSELNSLMLEQLQKDVESFNALYTLNVMIQLTGINGRNNKPLFSFGTTVDGLTIANRFPGADNISFERITAYFYGYKTACNHFFTHPNN